MIRYKQGRKPHLSLFVENDTIIKSRLGWELSPAKLVNWIKASYQAEVHEIYWYLSSPNQEWEETLKSELAEYKLFIKIRCLSNRTKELYPGEYYNKSPEVPMAIDMFLTAEDYDYGFLVTESESLERAVELLRSKQVRIFVIGTANYVPRELRNAADTFIEIQNLKKHLTTTPITRPQKNTGLQRAKLSG